MQQPCVRAHGGAPGAGDGGGRSRAVASLGDRLVGATVAGVPRACRLVFAHEYIRGMIAGDSGLIRPSGRM